MHMWQYPDFETRKRTREQAWSVDGWAYTVSEVSSYLLINKYSSLTLKSS